MDGRFQWNISLSVSVCAKASRVICNHAHIGECRRSIIPGETVHKGKWNQHIILHNCRCFSRSPEEREFIKSFVTFFPSLSFETSSKWSLNCLHFSLCIIFICRVLCTLPWTVIETRVNLWRKKMSLRKIHYMRHLWKCNALAQHLIYKIQFVDPSGDSKIIVQCQCHCR